ncbi:hypothetical protein EV646_113211 [Kribbella antiqua]|uniref:Uncharacterized protein n=1 Tax=Kribbella antiqua TaxID=2512217 RepID=A0A4R2IFJ0_9ACTN|nr:hypothetical protein [Kribbella antiqua]TCO42589.1 hypothetical protein EV646_113211 [Kribbella antiqua]
MNNLNDTLPGLMHRATENLEPVSTDLLERSLQQGIRLRRRRTTILSITGASAVLATAGLIVGGTQLFGSPSGAAVAGTTSPSAKASAAKPTAKPVTPKQTLATLKSLVAGPGRTLSKPESWGETDFAAAAYVVDDGKGASRVEVFVAGGNMQDPCAEPGAKCTVRSDGSKLFTATEQPEYTDGRQDEYGVVNNYVVLTYKDGRQISLTSYNGPAEKDAQHTRPKPLFTVAQLAALAENKAWKFPPASVSKGFEGSKALEEKKLGKTTK